MKPCNIHTCDVEGSINAKTTENNPPALQLFSISEVIILAAVLNKKLLESDSTPPPQPQTANTDIKLKVALCQQKLRNEVLLLQKVFV